MEDSIAGTVSPLAGSGQALHEFLFALKECSEVRASGAGFNAALDIGEFPLCAPVMQGLDAALGFFPG